MIWKGIIFMPNTTIIDLEKETITDSILPSDSSTVSADWQQAEIGSDRTSFMRCGGGNLCNESK